jgi:transcriptional regulator with XRE-family HTH domain
MRRFASNKGGKAVVASNSSRRRFGLLLRNQRIRAGMTQQEMAQAAFLSQSTVSSLEGGDKGTKRELVERLDAALAASASRARLEEIRGEAP